MKCVLYLACKSHSVLLLYKWLYCLLESDFWVFKLACQNQAEPTWLTGTVCTGDGPFFSKICCTLYYVHCLYVHYLASACMHSYTSLLMSVLFCFIVFFSGVFSFLFYNTLLEMNLGVVMFVVLHHVVRVCDTYCCDVSMSVITGARRK